MRKIGLFIVLIIALLGFTSCKKTETPKTPAEQLEAIMTDFNTNLVDCTNVVYDSTITDTDVVVKQINKDVNIVKNSDGSLSLTVITTNKNLSSSFVLEEQVLTDYLDGQMPETLFAYQFNYDAFSEIEVTDTSIKGVVKQDSVSTVLNTTVNNSSDLQVEINYEAGKITGYEFSYSTTNGNDVVISATYTY